jgi:hypothetical protein
MKQSVKEIKIFYIFLLLILFLFIGILTFFSTGNNLLHNYGDIDTFENENDSIESIESVFCTKYKSMPHKLRKHCKNLGKEGCHIPDCCILINNEECVPGDKQGPKYLSNNGKPIIIKFWEHNNTCYDGREICPKLN